MTIQTPLLIIGDAISRIQADATLANFISSTFGSTLKFFVGIDENEQPPESDCPFIAFRPGNMAPSEDRSHRSLSFDMAIIISDQTADTTTGAVTEMTGLQKIEDLYYHVERILDTWFNGSDWQYQAYIGETQLAISRPLFRISFTITAIGDYE